MKKNVGVSCKNDVENGRKQTTITIKSTENPIDFASLKNMSPLDSMLSTAAHLAGSAIQLKELHKQSEFQQEDFEERDVLLPNKPNLKHMDLKQLRSLVRDAFNK